MKKTIYIFLLLALMLTACSPKQTETNVVKIAVLPVLDVLPLYVAEQQGYFEDAGLEVELVNINSAPERDQLMQAGQVDAILNELVSTIFYNQNEVQVSVVRFARTATSTTPIFRLLSAPESGINTAEDLKNIPVGVSEGTVIEYTTDRILQKAGLENAEIEKIAIPKIPDRLALLLSGELQAANLPEPAASAALAQGANLVIDDTTVPQASCSVISFDAEFLENNPETVRKFLNAYEKAVADINADKTTWDGLLKEHSLMPEALIGKFELPDYPSAGAPSEEQYLDALEWVLDKGLIESEPAYEGSVSAEYLP